MRALSIAATGMLAQQTNVDVISNNIANMNTSGYKVRRPEFQDLLYQNERRVGANSSDIGTIVPSGVQIGLGVRTASVYRVLTQGPLKQTDNPLDLAIQGKGYFRVDMPNGTQSYTRAGSLQLGPEGTLETADGFPVSPGVTIPTDAIEVAINPTGEVQVKLPGQIGLQTVGQLELVTFPNEGGLEALGNNLFAETPSSGAAIVGTPGSPGFGTLMQYFVEGSNVDPVKEVTNMITAQRAYEMNSKVITAADEMFSTVTQLR